ncbi:MAG: Flp family type IVb pilin [Alphaproteobacteria bacterium]|nr:MAG: Flp family type IVb pilin [Alphaproteobacteria bacterium]
MSIKLIKKLRKNEAGATAVEYGLIAALVTIAIVATLTSLGTEITNTFSGIGDDLSQASTSGG